MKLNLGCGGALLDGFENLDKKTGWLWEAGLPYPDDSIEAITVSHSLMYVKDEFMVKIFQEFERVLIKGGVCRITEDATDDPDSTRFGGHPDAISMTSASKTIKLFRNAGMVAYEISENLSSFEDDSLLQNYHGGSPKCFFVEGKKL